MIVLNLLILIDNLDDPVLAEQAFDYVGTANTPLRYWAVRVITGPTLAKQALEKPQSDLAQRVLTTIRSLTNDPSPDILDLVVDFAAKQGGQPGQALLLDIADRRIARYRSGDVPDELLEIKLLKQLCARMTQDNPQKNIVAQRFTQLFDLVMQRYLEKQDTLSPDQKAKLVSVMAEIEDKCLPILLKQPQNNLRRALETGDMDRLQAERERLLGPSGVLKTL
jgi:hypothetical protein